MSIEANLLVTFDSREYIEARNEVIDVLMEVGNKEPELLYSEIRGLLHVRIEGDSKKITRKLDALCRRNPSRFWFTYHWTPIEKWCPSTIDDMTQVVKQLAKGARASGVLHGLPSIRVRNVDSSFYTKQVFNLI